MTNDITTLQDRIGKTNAANGWHDYYKSLEPGSLAANDHIIVKLALIDTEVAEGIEEIRNGHAPDETYFSEGGKMEGVPSELADVVIRAFDTAELIGFDLLEVIEAKLVYNATRGKHHGGKTV